MNAIRHTLALLASAAICTTPLAAQSDSLAAHTDSTASTHVSLFSPSDAVWTVLFTGASIGMMHYDEKIADYMQRPDVQSNSVLREIDRDFNRVNETTLTLAGVGIFAITRLSHASTAADISLHATEGVVLSTLANEVLRGVIGRARPDLPGLETRDAHLFKPGKGFSDFDYRSFPSIHASSNYSAATVIVGEVRERWPAATWYVAPPLYVVASMPSLARLHENRHWASDIVAGAFLGTFVGAKVVRYHHHVNPHNWLDRALLHLTIAPGAVGFSGTY